MDISSSGRVAWQLRLPTDPVQSGISLQPLVLGGTAVFAEENAVYALRLSDGRHLWRMVFPKSGDFYASAVYGLWQWRGTVIVFAGQVSSAPRLVSLDVSTGAVRWTLPLSRQGVTGSLALTGDGGLAMIQGYATLTVADLATGRVRWSRAAAHSLGPVAAGGVVAVAAQGIGVPAGTVAGYDVRTGALLWTRRDMPNQPLLLVSAGRLIVYSGTQNVFPRPSLWPVTALSSATGRTLWQAGTAGPVSVLSAGPSGIAVSTVNPKLLYLIDPVTGRVRWHVSASAGAAPLDTGTDLLYLGSGPGNSRGLVDLRAADGSVRWAAGLGATAAPGGTGPMSRFGEYIVLAGGAPQPGSGGLLSAFWLSTGKAAWTTEVPTLIQVPPAVAGSSLLVQPTDPAAACPAAGAVSGAVSGAGRAG